MRRRVPGWRATGCAALVAAAVGIVRAETVVPWQAAGSYTGDVVTVEGDVVRAHLDADTCVLEFSPGDDTAFRVVLLIPLMTDLPRQPQRLYEGKRVRATGRVRTWQGRPEMIVRDPDAIEVIGVGTAASGEVPPPPPPTTVAPPPPPPTTTPAPVAAPPASLVTPTTARAPVTTLPPPPPAAPAAAEPEEEEAPRLPRRVDPCDAARARWQRAAADAEARAAALNRCLRAGAYRCRPAGAAMAPALTELEWAEQQVEAACP
jgi:hypothetical protein